MSKLTVTVNFGNAGTVDEHDEPNPDALDRMFRRVTRDLSDGETTGVILDINGNTVGHYDLR